MDPRVAGPPASRDVGGRCGAGARLNGGGGGDGADDKLGMRATRSWRVSKQEIDINERTSARRVCLLLDLAVRSCGDHAGSPFLSCFPKSNSISARLERGARLSLEGKHARQGSQRCSGGLTSNWVVIEYAMARVAPSRGDGTFLPAQRMAQASAAPNQLVNVTFQHALAVLHRQGRSLKNAAQHGGQRPLQQRVQVGGSLRPDSLPAGRRGRAGRRGGGVAAAVPLHHLPWHTPRARWAWQPAPTCPPRSPRHGPGRPA